jgi:hypothetical protein
MKFIYKFKRGPESCQRLDGKEIKLEYTNFNTRNFDGYLRFKLTDHILIDEDELVITTREQRQFLRYIAAKSRILGQ